MPELCRFYGIIIRMFTETGQDNRAVYGFSPIELLAGELPRRQQRLVEAWMELYREELLEDWQLALAGEPVNKIPPLQ